MRSFREPPPSLPILPSHDRGGRSCLSLGVFIASVSLFLFIFMLFALLAKTADIFVVK